MKMNRLFFMLLLAFVLTACQALGAAPQPTGEVLPTVVSDTAVSVQGKLVPASFVTLSFNLGGTLQELPAAEGQAVKAGQTLASLDQRERLAAAVASAQLEQVTARQALQTLKDNAEVNTAAALQKVADARDAVRSAERYVNNLNEGSRSTDIESAQANVVLLADQLKKAKEDYAAYENKPEDNVTRATYLSKMADAQNKYDNAVRLLNNLSGTASEIDLSIAQANLLLAQASLSLAEKDYEEVKNGGPNPDDLEAAQGRLDAAESSLAAAQAAQDDAELVAPFSGTIVKINVKQGEQVVPGSPAIILADFSNWQVETDDLNEMEIPRVQVGQGVTITPDALPELKLRGKVDSIGQLFEEKFGDVTYTAKITLDEPDPRLRWGMTVAVRFDP